jgi:hypothetical protein
MWTNVSKPSTLAWTNINPIGKEQYDQADLTYDDVDVFYDGVNPSAWSNIAKPVSSTWTKINKPT